MIYARDKHTSSGHSWTRGVLMTRAAWIAVIAPPTPGSPGRPRAPRNTSKSSFSGNINNNTLYLNYDFALPGIIQDQARFAALARCRSAGTLWGKSYSGRPDINTR